jgi:hypothetical protein
VKLWDGHRRPESFQNDETRLASLGSWNDSTNQHIFTYFDKVYEERYHVKAPDEFEMRVKTSDLVDLVFTMMDTWKDDFDSTVENISRLSGDDHDELFKYHDKMMSRDIYNIKKLKWAVDNKKALAILKTK